MSVVTSLPRNQALLVDNKPQRSLQVVDSVPASPELGSSQPTLVSAELLKVTSHSGLPKPDDLHRNISSTKVVILALSRCPFFQ